MRAVLDPNVIISATLSPRGSPGLLWQRWLDGAYDLIVSRQLTDELDRALGYPKLRVAIPTSEREELLDLIVRTGFLIEVPPTQASRIRSRDPNDDYLIDLATVSRSVLVSGDKDLLELAEQMPVYSPAGFLTLLDRLG